MSESALRDEIAEWGRSLFDRGLTPGSSGNIRRGPELTGTPKPTGLAAGLRPG